MIALAASAVVVLGAVLLLVIKVKAEPSYEVDPAEIAKAKSAYERRTRDIASPTPTTTRRSRRTRRPRRRTTMDKKKDEKPEVARPSRPLSRTTRPALAGRAIGSKIAINRGGANDDLKKRMARANRFYDRGAYEEAKQAAMEILKESPRNIRMLRIVVSTACVMGDPAIAKQYSARLPRRDLNQMKRRCKHYNVNL
jgi:hypothetical protein